MSGDVLSEIVLSFFGLDGHAYPDFIPELELEWERLLVVNSLRLISLSQRMSVPSTSSPGCIRGHRLCIHVNLFLDDKNICSYQRSTLNCLLYWLAKRRMS